MDLKALPNGAKLTQQPGLNPSKVQAMFATYDSFVSMCQIVREDESSGFLTPTSTQQQLIAAYHENRWNIVNKRAQGRNNADALLPRRGD